MILATQRPDATVLPGQIKSLCDIRIAGRCDQILSQIILDNSDADEQIPKDERGLFSMIWIGRDARGMIDMEENHENENRIPNHVIDNLARCLLPKIQTYFETENGQLAFQAWAEDKKNTQTQV